MTITITKLSPAKINLFLEVKNRRNDGYHDIQSLMTFCDFGDMLCVSKSNDFRIKLDGPFSSSLINKENLIHRTLKKLEDLFERNFNVEVVLKKNLPIASGMAGGSSNAATFITCVKEIFKLEEVDGFNELLLSLGADVPFCYNGKTALVTGIGENIKFTENLREYFVLLVNPKIAVSTKEIFNNFHFKDISHKEDKIILSNLIKLEFFKERSNHLENYAIKQFKIIGEILSFLSKIKGSVLSRMTGSGATCFALFDCVEDLEEAEYLTTKRFKDCWIKSTKLKNNIKDKTCIKY